MVSRSLLLSPHAETLAMNALAEVIIRCDEERIRANQHQIDPRIERVINHCRVRLERVFLLPELAALAGLSPTSFSRLFAQEMGMPPMRYLEQLRINRACRLLELSQAKIESVARQVGFANPFYFTLRFKRQLGVSPRQYRLQAGRKRPTPRSVR
jgi:AraC family transcriptional regulator of arabinose operon